MKKSWLFTATKKELRECICSEWDGKGWSTCGFPCSIHNKLSKKKLKKIVGEQNAFLKKFRDNLIKKRLKESQLLNL